jgi:6-phosphogluconolactonase
MDTEIRIVDDVPSAFADIVTELAPATFGLSGGSTAKRCYAELGRRAGNWSATQFLVSDERWVPVGHADSNEGQARREWLDRVDTGEIHSMREAGETIEAAADAYDALLKRLGTIDLVHLGLGDDGHTASLFPDSPDLAVTDRLVVATGDDLHEWPRLSFTYPAIERCRTVVLTATGEGKREAFQRVLRGDPAMPATHVRADRVLWLLDPAVGGEPLA